MRLACVLKSGGGYNASHVARLHAQLKRHLPGYDLVCLSDVDVPCERIHLQYDWPGWWAKMCLFHPDIDDDILFFDLDTVIVRDISEFAQVCRTTLLSDFHSEYALASGLMYLAQEDRDLVWRGFISDPGRHIRRFSKAGDQGFLREFKHLRTAARWQNKFPGQVISYKSHIQLKGGDRELPADARIVCFHGQPRPWQISAPWVTQHDSSEKTS